MSIKPIETIYKNYRFRSRLEARWGVFFDALGIKWEYEKEGYDLDGVWYLPDFWLPEQDCWIEIKGQEPTDEEIQKALRLSKASRKHVYILVGEIGLTDRWLRVARGDVRVKDPREIARERARGVRPRETVSAYDGYGYADGLPMMGLHLWAECENCDAVRIVPATDEGIAHDCDNSGPKFRAISHRLISAYTAARQARFEHGERGVAMVRATRSTRSTLSQQVGITRDPKPIELAEPEKEPARVCCVCGVVESEKEPLSRNEVFNDVYCEYCQDRALEAIDEDRVRHCDNCGVAESAEEPLKWDPIFYGGPLCSYCHEHAHGLVEQDA